MKGCPIETERIEVDSYSGYKRHERPIQFTYKNTTLKIKKVLDRSLETHLPGGERLCRFKVLAEDNHTYTLLYDEHQDQWYLEIKLSQF